MPVRTNTIGGYALFDLVLALPPLQDEIELIPRPGVDGMGARNLGSRGEAFAAMSVTYHSTFDSYHADLASYKGLIGSGLAEVVRNSTLLGYFLVLNVSEAKPPQSVYNVAGASYATVRAELKWKLLQMSYA